MRPVTLLSACFLALFSIVRAASVETQSDWSGGGGVLGPVTEWGNEFHSSTNVSWFSYPGLIYLSSHQADSFEKHNVASGVDKPMWIRTTDIDNDKDADIVVATYEGNRIRCYINEGYGKSWSPASILNDFKGAYKVCPGDFDHDGDTDLAATGITNGEIVWAENVDGDGLLWEKHTISADYEYPVSLWVAEVTGDCLPDVLTSSHILDEVTLWENDRSGNVWIKRTIDDEITTPVWVRAGDMDGDGDLDVVVCNNIIGSAYGYIALYENEDGSGETWAKRLVGEPSIAGRRYTNLVDVEGDGDLDIIVAVGSSIILYKNTDGSGKNWFIYVIKSHYTGLRPLYASDVDEDNDFDVITGNSLDNEVRWWENRGGSIFTEWSYYRICDSYDTTSGIDTGDIDGNYDFEIVASDILGREISWWDVTEFETDGTLESSILDTEVHPYWGYISWEPGGLPVNGFTEFFVRSSNDPEDMGEWFQIGDAQNVFLGDYLEDHTRYFQYKVALTHGFGTPAVSEIRVTWFPATGVGDCDFDAVSEAEGIALTWERGSVDYAGYNLLRSAAHDGLSAAPEKINAGLITGAPPHRFLDSEVSEGTTYEYWLEAVDAGGGAETWGPVACTWGGDVPLTYALYQSRPNPARGGTTTIAFDLPAETKVTLNVYDISGRKVATPVNAFLTAGNHTAEVSGLASGVYVYRMKTDEFAGVRKMVILE
ncbi:MAG: T9SS type A sorting domain-containing protein [Candidatus Coatesbacteria bacterium]|nr:MAG: T9SS type A sorting domain-containing protein [Candidatus Coatesbacteria bacterium]